MLANRHSCISLAVLALWAMPACKAKPDGQEQVKADKADTKTDDKADTKAPEPKPDAPPPTDGPDQNCPGQVAWVTTPSEPDAAAFSANSNCSFHQWAYQTFLWLTSPGSDGKLVFEAFANPDALFVPGGPTGPYPGGSDGPHVLARFGKSRPRRASPARPCRSTPRPRRATTTPRKTRSSNSAPTPRRSRAT